MVDFVGYLYAICAFAALLLLGRGLVFVLSFGRHQDNPVYRLFCFLTRPLVKAARFIAPKVIADSHLPLVAFLVLFWACVGFALWLPVLMRLR